MKILAPMDARGRFSVYVGGDPVPRAVVNNVFTREGSAFLAAPGPNYVSVGLSSDSESPDLFGPGSVFRTSSSLTESFVSRALVPDENGLLWWRKSYRFAFPAIPGSGSKTIRQLVAMVDGSVLVGGVSSAPVSAALLKLADGSSTRVVFDQSTEDVEVVWEYTERFLPEYVGTVQVVKRNGLGATLYSGDHSYTLRPANLNNTDSSLKGWGDLAGRLFPSTQVSSAAVKLGTGSLGYAGSEPAFSEWFNPASVTPPVANPAADQFIVSCSLSFDNAVSSRSISCAQFMLGHTEWQVAFDPPIEKTNSQVARIDLSLTTR